MPALLLILACALWAVSFPIVKVLHLEQSARLGSGASSVFLASWMQVARFGLAAIVLLPFAVGKNLPTGKEVRQGVVLAFWGGAGMWLQADALAYTEASTSAFLTQAYCIFLPLWACIRTRRGPGSKVTVATVMVLAGGAILSGMRPDHLKLGRGELETLMAAFVFTFQILCLENPRYEGNRGIPVSFVMFVAIAVMFVPVTMGTAPDLPTCLEAGRSVESFSLVAALALFCSAGAYVLMIVWQPRVPATEAGLIYTTEPVFTAGYVLFLPTLLGSFVGESYPNEVVTVRLVTGGLLILAANVLMQWKKRPHLAGVVVE
ncbi:MAG: DMT family transporter [Verrucomicrobiaceae bacterium]|nr:MAG: DMT family transporter [Verrucomicrobiaceae bacterium]